MEKYSFGKKALIDAINNKLKIKKVYLLNEKSFDLKLLQDNNISYCFKPKDFFKNSIKSIKLESVVFELSQFNKSLSLEYLINNILTKDNALVLIIDEIQDLGNIGAILRSADAFGVDAVIYKKNNQANPFCDTVIKTSTNAINYLNMCEVSNLNNAISKLKEKGFWIYASTLDNESITYDKEIYHSKTVIIVGNEHKGISYQLQKNSDFKIYIPQIGHVQSLNVSVATGILLANYRTKYKK